MWKSNFHNQGQSLIGIIIVLVIVGLISGGLYYYLSKQIPEVPEITEKPVEEVVPEKKVKREEEVEDIVLKEITHNLVVDFLDWFKSSTVALPFQLKNYSIENVYIDEIREDCFGTTVEYSVETPVKSDYWKTGSWAYNKKLFADIIKDDEKYKIRELGTSRSATSYWGISGWKTYRNDEYGFEVQYPEDAEIVESQFPGTIRIDLPYILGTTLSEKYLIISTKGSIPEECSNPMSIMIRETETVYFNDIEFKKESGDEIAAGNVYESVSYSKMRENKCISLSFVLRSANRGVFYGFDVPPDFDQEKES